MFLLGIVGFAIAGGAAKSWAQPSSDSPRWVRTIGAGEDAGSGLLGISALQPLNTTFDANGNRRLMFDTESQSLLGLPAVGEGFPAADQASEKIAGPLPVQNPHGVSIDLATGEIHILDANGPKIVTVHSHGGGLGAAVVSSLDLSGAGLGEVRGIAFDSESGNFQILNPAGARLYEVTAEGQVAASRDVSGLGLIDPQAMMFAPSGDQTDDPSVTTLYIADSGAESLVEISLAAVEEVAPSIVATLINTINAWTLSPPSPDTSGAVYHSTRGTLFLADSEVNEIPGLFDGSSNLFEINLTGALQGTFSTTAFSNEPTGIAYNPANEHIFISDDIEKKVYEVNPGPDTFYNTGDDIVTFFRTDDFGSDDPEGITFDTAQGFLYIVDGVNAQVYQVDPGGNGVFDGVVGPGDDVVTSFDVAQFGVVDPEGIAYDTDNGLLFVVGRTNRDTLTAFTTSGTLVQVMDISGANTFHPSGLAFGPRSNGPGTSLYITDRGVDNNVNPSENDGKVYEIAALVVTPGNIAPVVDAGADQPVTLPAGAVLDGSVTSDDGVPGPATVTWSKVDGPPGTVNFTDPNSLTPTATFTLPGTYVLRLTGFDGELIGFDDVTITVTGAAGETGVGSQIATDFDDAEESASGVVSPENSDLEMVQEITLQTVGLRFNNITVPQCSEITNAFVQFTADETSDPGAASLIIHGQDAANAPTFAKTIGNISLRPRTLTSAAWNPPAWTAGDAGAAQQTSDISSVIQEIVDLPGWSSGNSLALIVTGAGTRTAVAHDTNPNQGAQLFAEYVTSATNRAPRVRISSPLDGAAVNEGANVTFTGTADDCIDSGLSAGLEWDSNLDGPLNGGAPTASFSTAGLSVGTHTITARVTDSGTLQGQISITLHVIQPVGPVTDADADANEVLENAVPGTTVGITASATDPNGETVTYSFSNGLQTTNDGLFSIDANSGVITVAGALDYETNISHQVTVRATSTDTSTSQQAFTINVLDVVNEAVRDEVIVDFGPGFGIWIWRNNTAWDVAPLHTLPATHIVAADLNNNGKKEVIIDFGPGFGIWIYRDDAGWDVAPLHPLSATHIATGDIDGS